MDQFQFQEKLGDGTYGVVFKAIQKQTGEIVAVKILKSKYHNIEDLLKVNEVRVLRRLRNQNIIQLKDALVHQEQAYLVFEHMEKNLFSYYMGFKRKGMILPANQIQSIMKQLIEGLAYMHKQGFFHRDLKPENILIHRGKVKICDFGLAKEIRSKSPLTEYVATRWYRAPELILKANTYNSSVDIFALGCIMVELFTFKPLFPGANEIDQLHKIIQILGMPSQENWPDGVKLAKKCGFVLPELREINLQDIIQSPIQQDALEIIQDMLQLDPRKRPSAEELLKRPYFQNQLDSPTLLKQMSSQHTPVFPLIQKHQQQQQQIQYYSNDKYKNSPREFLEDTSYACGSEQNIPKKLGELRSGIQSPVWLSPQREVQLKNSQELSFRKYQPQPNVTLFRLGRRDNDVIHLPRIEINGSNISQPQQITTNQTNSIQRSHTKIQNQNNQSSNRYIQITQPKRKISIRRDDESIYNINSIQNKPPSYGQQLQKIAKNIDRDQSDNKRLNYKDLASNALLPC